MPFSSEPIPFAVIFHISGSPGHFTSPSQDRISHSLWGHTKSIRPALTTKALRMSSGFPSAQPIPSCVWPQLVLRDREAAWGPPSELSPSLLSHFLTNVSSRHPIMTDGCKVTGWGNVLFYRGGHDTDTVVTSKRPICQPERGEWENHFVSNRRGIMSCAPTQRRRLRIKHTALAF